MAEAYTDRARSVIATAGREAQSLNHCQIDPVHLLLGLVNEQRGIAAMALAAMRVSASIIRGRVEAVVVRGSCTSPLPIAFSDQANRVLEFSATEAAGLGHSLVGTEHLLLGLIGAGDDVAARMLIDAGADVDRTRDQVVAILSLYSRGASALEEAESHSRKYDEESMENLSTNAALAVELESRLSEIRAARLVAINDNQLEAAGELRDQERDLLQQLSELRRRLG